MSIVEPVDEWWGQTNLLTEELRIKRSANALFVPSLRDKAWGLYDACGELIKEGVDFVRGEAIASGQLLDRQDPFAFEAWAPEHSYLYVGVMNPHYGHFIVNSLSRFCWALENRPPGTHLLCHSPIPLDALKTFPFIRDILDQIGIDLAQLHTFDMPTKILNVHVAETGFREQFAIHPDFRKLCLSIGSKLVTFPTQASNIVYLSKARLKGGVGLLDAEAELEEQARVVGCQIVHPETLSFREQLEIFANAKVIIGTVGSALHTSIFCPGGKTIIGLSPTPQINSNFGLIDRLTGNQCIYFAPLQGEIDRSHPSNFLTLHRPKDPVRLARDFFEQVSKLL